MAITWNSITLKVLVSSDWNPGTPSTNITEIPLLPDPNNPGAIASVIQQGPTLRNRAKGRIYLSSMDDYNTLATAWKSGTTATLNDGNTLNATYMIETLGPAVYKQSDVIFADISLVEV